MDVSETPEGEREQELLANLRDLIDEAGQGGAARQLGVDRKTLWRVLDSGRLTPLVTEALERRGANPEAARRRGRLDALERTTKALDRDVEGLDEAVEALRDEFRTLADLQAEALRAWERRLAAVESQQAGAAAPATEPRGAGRGDGAPSSLQGLVQQVIGHEQVPRPHRDHPEVVTLRAEAGEELVYGEAAPVIVEWRRQRIAHLDKGASGVEHARAWVRMCELELLLIGEYGLTLPPDTDPWTRPGSGRSGTAASSRCAVRAVRWCAPTAGASCTVCSRSGCGGTERQGLRRHGPFPSSATRSTVTVMTSAPW